MFSELADAKATSNQELALRAVEAGETFTVTVRGRRVACVVLPGHGAQPRTDVDRATP